MKLDYVVDVAHYATITIHAMARSLLNVKNVVWQESYLMTLPSYVLFLIISTFIVIYRNAWSNVQTIGLTHTKACVTTKTKKSSIGELEIRSLLQ